MVDATSEFALSCNGGTLISELGRRNGDHCELKDIVPAS
jgi:hypothetical protein